MQKNCQTNEDTIPIKYSGYRTSWETCEASIYLVAAEVQMYGCGLFVERGLGRGLRAGLREPRAAALVRALRLYLRLQTQLLHSTAARQRRTLATQYAGVGYASAANNNI